MIKEFRIIRNKNMAKDYLSGISIVELARKYNLRNHCAVMFTLKKMGVYGKTPIKEPIQLTEREQRIKDNLKKLDFKTMRESGIKQNFGFTEPLITVRPRRYY